MKASHEFYTLEEGQIYAALPISSTILGQGPCSVNVRGLGYVEGLNNAITTTLGKLASLFYRDDRCGAYAAAIDLLNLSTEFGETLAAIGIPLESASGFLALSISSELSESLSNAGYIADDATKIEFTSNTEESLALLGKLTTRLIDYVLTKLRGASLKCVNDWKLRIDEASRNNGPLKLLTSTGEYPRLFVKSRAKEIPMQYEGGTITAFGLGYLVEKRSILVESVLAAQRALIFCDEGETWRLVVRIMDEFRELVPTLTTNGIAMEEPEKTLQATLGPDVTAKAYAKSHNDWNTAITVDDDIGILRDAIKRFTEFLIEKLAPACQRAMIIWEEKIREFEQLHGAVRIADQISIEQQMQLQLNSALGTMNEENLHQEIIDPAVAISMEDNKCDSQHIINNSVKMDDIDINNKEQQHNTQQHAECSIISVGSVSPTNESDIPVAPTPSQQLLPEHNVNINFISNEYMAENNDEEKICNERPINQQIHNKKINVQLGVKQETDERLLSTVQLEAGTIGIDSTEKKAEKNRIIDEAINKNSVTTAVPATTTFISNSNRDCCNNNNSNSSNYKQSSYNTNSVANRENDSDNVVNKTIGSNAAADIVRTVSIIKENDNENIATECSKTDFSALNASGIDVTDNNNNDTNINNTTTNNTIAGVVKEGLEKNDVQPQLSQNERFQIYEEQRSMKNSGSTTGADSSALPKAGTNVFSSNSLLSSSSMSSSNNNKNMRNPFQSEPINTKTVLDFYGSNNNLQPPQYQQQSQPSHTLPSSFPTWASNGAQFGMHTIDQPQAISPQVFSRRIEYNGLHQQAPQSQCVSGIQASSINSSLDVYPQASQFQQQYQPLSINQSYYKQQPNSSITDTAQNGYSFNSASSQRRFI